MDGSFRQMVSLSRLLACTCSFSSRPASCALLGQVQKAYRPVCQITADLGSLVENSKVCGDGIKAFVFLDIFVSASITLT